MKRSSLAIVWVVAVLLCPLSDGLIRGVSTGWEGINWMTRGLATLTYTLILMVVIDLLQRHR